MYLIIIPEMPEQIEVIIEPIKELVKTGDFSSVMILFALLGATGFAFMKLRKYKKK